METFTEPKELLENPRYSEQKDKTLANFSKIKIDEPIIRIIRTFNKLPYCFTLQCCYGHFVYEGQENPHNFDPLPISKNIPTVEYRIAYVAFCIENSYNGKKFFEDLRELTFIDPENIQLCSADWFWKQQVNSYALQVEPERFKHLDSAILDYEEALNIEKIRNAFFNRLDGLLYVRKEVLSVRSITQ